MISDAFSAKTSTGSEKKRSPNMPTIDIDYQELQNLIGIPLNKNMEKLDDILSYIKAEVKQYNSTENTVNIEFKDTNRPDLWSVEGLTRALQGYLNIKNGIKPYHLNESAAEVTVDKRLSTIRPFICCSIIKNVQLTDAIIRGLMHLQDKLDKTYGRSRQKTSIGLYDLDQIKLPLNYTVAKPTEFSFIPLGYTEKMTLAEMLERHPKGQEYGHIVRKHPFYPILLDSEQKVLSFPPIINSNDLGRVTQTAHNLLIEVTGTMHQTVQNTLNLVTLALIDRGGKAHAATIHYPEGTIYKSKNVTTPNFSNRTVNLSVEYTNRLLGLDLKCKEIAQLLSIAGFDIAKTEETNLEVLVPCYRIDIMHQVDLIEDVAVAYGYNNIEPVWRDLPTTGQARSQQRLVNVARELMIGLGYQEISTYTLTNPQNLFSKMNRQPIENVEIANPKLVTMTCLRNWLMPSIIEFLSNNESVEFPQRVFELGKVTLLDETQETRTRDEEWIAAATTHINAGFSEIKSALDAFFTNLGIPWQIQETQHPSFIQGRAGEVLVNGEEVGVLGEISPQVLNEWKLENPIAAFEINAEKILKQRK
jgi:phenylalanyl-tRNA synthetase beta chain